MTHTVRCLFACLLMVVPAAGCGVGVETDPKGIVETGSGGGSGDPTVSHDNPCPEPDGPRHDASTVAEVEQLVIGSWVQCSGTTPTPFPPEAKGLELAADRNYYVLVRDARGGLVRNPGFESRGTWNVKDVGAGAIILELWITPSSVMGDTPLFEDGPRRFSFDQLRNGSSKPAIYQAVRP